MSRIRIHQDNQPVVVEPYSNALNGFGTVIELDGQPLNGVRDITLHVGVDDVTTVNLDVIAEESFDVELNADVHVQITPVKGAGITATPLPDGGTGYAAFWDEYPPVRPTFKFVRGVVGWSFVMEDIDITHLNSPDVHREHAAGRGRSYVYLRTPVWMFRSYWYLKNILKRVLSHKREVPA